MNDRNIILIDIDIHSDDKKMKAKLKKFVENYKKYRDKLCKHLSSGTNLSVPESIKEYKEYENGKIYYLFDKNKTEIIAFAIISTNHYNITTLNWLCSSNNIDKTKTRMDGKRLGIYLLDLLYDKYVKEKNGILKIEPANKELVSYYSLWKPPSLPCELYEENVGIIPSLPDTIFDTAQYLVYFDKELDLSERQINHCIYGIKYNEEEFTLDQVRKELLKIYVKRIDKKIKPERERKIVLRTVDISKDDKNGYKELKTFVNNFKIYYFNGKLCVDPNRPGSEPVNFIPITLSQYKNYTKIYYLFDENNTEIVAFAIIDLEDPLYKIMTLSYLCSSINIDKTNDKMDGKPFDIYLLDLVYDEYVNQNEGNVLKIDPANKNLVDYFSKWKMPTLPSIVLKTKVMIINSIQSFNTDNHLVYFNKNIPLNDHQIIRLIQDVNEFEFICSELDLEMEDVLKEKKEDRKVFLHDKDKEHYFKECIESINYYTLDDIKKALKELYKIKEYTCGVEICTASSLI
jgi:hypothetical protein